MRPNSDGGVSWAWAHLKDLGRRRGEETVTKTACTSNFGTILIQNVTQIENKLIWAICKSTFTPQNMSIGTAGRSNMVKPHSVPTPPSPSNYWCCCKSINNNRKKTALWGGRDWPYKWQFKDGAVRWTDYNRLSIEHSVHRLLLKVRQTYPDELLKYRCDM